MKPDRSSFETGEDVLIVGAGPTGLFLALVLHRLGVKVRIIDKTSAPGTTSRALGVHARTLEFYAQLGLAEEIVDRGLPFTTVNLWVQGRRAVQVPFAEHVGDLTPFPYILIFPQDEHEKLLIRHLEKEGVRIERQTELTDFSPFEGGVRARLRGPNGEEEIYECAYLAGCDGTHSAVRKKIGAGFPGGTYEHMFYVADVEAEGERINGELHVDIEPSDILLVFPLKGTSSARLIGTIKRSREEEEKGELRWEDINPAVLEGMKIKVNRVNWFSSYHVHHRVAKKFREDRVFLLGDAAHIHSPVGAQGLNTGLGDAMNLAWKLAGVIQGRHSSTMLDTYEPERRGFALTLVETTDRLFQAVTSRRFLARLFRMRLMPALIPRISRFESLRRFVFKRVSQIHIHYPHSALSGRSSHRLKGGARLPWAGENFEVLKEMKWQVHVFGETSALVRDLCREWGVEIKTFKWRRELKAAGFEEEALYLVRPDGYLALADEEASHNILKSYFERHFLKAPKTKAFSK
jgi:2-polyprenyl-6-methoxyphenol hydroxylase-like FAD-dependent oxidoreductase